MNEDLEYKTIDLSIKIRGTILDSTVKIERKIDDFLSEYFCKSNQIGIELKEMLWATERINLSGKKDILFLLLNRHYKDIIKQHPLFIDCLDKLIPHRNIFAHMELDLDYSDYQKGNFEIKFKKYHQGKLQIKRYNRAAIEKMHDDFLFVNEVLDLLLTSKAP